MAGAGSPVGPTSPPVTTAPAPATTAAPTPTTKPPTATTKPPATTAPAPTTTTVPPTTTTAPVFGDLFVFTPGGPVFAGQNANFTVTFNLPILAFGLRSDARVEVARFIPLVGRTLAPTAQAVPLVATFNIPGSIELLESSWACVQKGNVTCDLPPTEQGGSATSAFVLAIPENVGDTIEFNTFLDIGGQRVNGPRIVIKVQAPPAGAGTPATQATVVADTIVVATRPTTPQATKPTAPQETPAQQPEATLETVNATRNTSPPTGTTSATTEASVPPPPLQQAPPTETSPGADLG